MRNGLIEYGIFCVYHHLDETVKTPLGGDARKLEAKTVVTPADWERNALEWLLWGIAHGDDVPMPGTRMRPYSDK